ARLHAQVGPLPRAGGGRRRPPRPPLRRRRLRRGRRRRAGARGLAPLVTSGRRRPHRHPAPPARGEHPLARSRRSRHGGADRSGAGARRRHLPDHDAAPPHLQRGAHDRGALPLRHAGDHQPHRDGRRRRQAPGRLRGRAHLRSAWQHRAGDQQGVPAVAGARRGHGRGQGPHRRGRLLQPVL
ncbi:MAG: SepF, FtsZ-interacting protein related to cell division, partial [uncultured Frankineae bacterium]